MDFGVIFICLLILLIPLIMIILVLPNKKESLDKLFLLFERIKNLFILIIMVSILLFVFIISGWTDEITIDFIIKYSIYLSFIISFFLLINFYSLKAMEVNILKFVDKVLAFFKDNMILNFAILFISIYLKTINKDLVIGLIGSYLFYFLSVIGDFKQKKLKNSYKLSFIYVVVINLYSLYIARELEQIYFGRNIFPFYLSILNVLIISCFTSLTVYVYNKPFKYKELKIFSKN